MDRISSEKHTVGKMIGLYCRLQHRQGSLCPQCRQLLEYTALRLDHCKFGLNKPVCAKCNTHCYRVEMRDRIRMVMRFSGPRMIGYHPLELLLYLIRKVRY